MRYLLFCLVLAGSLWGQQAPSAPSKGAPQPPIPRDEDDQQSLPASASTIAPDAAVVTIKGLCIPPISSPRETPRLTCRTQVSRAEFEKLADAILTNKQAARERQLAESYPKLLAMAQAAEARGLETNERVQQRLAFVRLQILSQELVRQIEEDSANIPEKEIEDYYHEHSSELETATLERIYIPNHKQSVLADEKNPPQAELIEQKDADAEMKQLAEKMRARAVAGEAFLTLQKEAYTAAGFTDVPPNPSLGQLRRSGLPPSHASVFDLRPGEVSKVFSDATGHYIYKLDSMQTAPTKQTNEEIRKMLRRQRRDKAIQAIQAPVSADLNPEYFGSAESGEANSPK